MDAPRVERPRMADYGVPDDPAGALAWSWAEERLARSRNYWVVTVDPAGRPHAMPVWGVWQAEGGDAAFWFSCSPTSLKARNLAANPHVVVAADDTVEVVSLEGEAAAVDSAAAGPAIAAYVAKYWPDDEPEPHAEFLRTNAVFRVTPRRAFGIIEREDEFGPRATRWRWAP